MPICQFCNSDLSTNSSLKVHQRTSKICLKVQGIEPTIRFLCDICNKNFLTKITLQRHISYCIKNTKDIRDKIVSIEDKNASIIYSSSEKYKDLEEKYNIVVEEKKILEFKYNMVIKKKKILEFKYDNLLDKITTSAISKTNNTNNILHSQKNNTEIILCKLSLDNKNFVHIPVRKDGMVNATSLCKAGNKLFGDYKRNKQTDEYLHALSAVMEIPITALINIKQGGNNKYEQGTWVHRKVAIHLAQWISPYFAVQVSRWIDELLICGSVTLCQEKSNNELDNEFKSVISNTTTEKKLSIDMEPYHEKDVLYIYNVNPKEELNIQIPQDKHCYEFGVTSNIKQRDSAYNNDKCYDKVRLDRIVEYKDRNSLARGEKRIKTIVKDLGLKLEVKNKKECFIANKDEYDRIYDNIIEHSNSINDKSSTKSNDKEENEFSIELEKYRIDKEKEKELEIEKNTTDVEIKKYKIDKENENDNEKTKKIMEMFENGKLTFEQMYKLLTYLI